MTAKVLVNSSLAILIGTGLFACKKNEEAVRAELSVPATYESADFTANTVVETNLATQLANLTAEIKKGRTNGTALSKNTLWSLFTAGETTLKDKCSVYYAGKIDGYIVEVAKASSGTYTPSAQITGEGGTFGGYLFDENGLEYEQMIEKGQFGAVLYKHLLDVLAGNLTEASVDKMVSIIGANPSFPNTTTTSANVPKPDKYLAGYIARRDKNDGNGLYSQLKKAFLKLKAAIRAGSDYNKERDEAIATIKLTIEKGNAATMINYCHSVIATLSATNPTDAQKGAALHAYSECVGFIHGWRTLGDKKITDAQIDEVLTLFNAPYNGTPTSYKFVTDSANELPKIQQIITKLRDIYGFTAQEIEDFKQNWVSVQGR